MGRKRRKRCSKAITVQSHHIRASSGELTYWEVVEDVGGRDRDRTGDLIVANDALSQLSYSPTGARKLLVKV